jgi:hypothetical protein
MKLLSIVFVFCYLQTTAQFELSSGYAVNKEYADGIPIQLACDFKIKNKFYTKSQIGYKYLHHYNDFVEATLKYFIAEIHQTFSYEVVKKNKYILKPNVGFNYRFYTIKAAMMPPYNTIPQRAWILFFRKKTIRLNSYDNDGTRNETYRVNNLGFTFQLQNQFRISSKIWLHITPFLEPDYDRIENTGGCYVGIILKKQ